MPLAANSIADQDILADYDYDLPPELVAQTPAQRRSAARLLVFNPATAAISHRQVAALPDLLAPGDLLVLNDTRVVPARLPARKPGGGQSEVFFLHPARPQHIDPAGKEWHQVLIRGKVKEGTVLTLQARPEIELRLLKKNADGTALVEVPLPALELAARYGLTPLPPYIKRPQGVSAHDRQRYQTVFARKAGAVAAPTAGLHFSAALLARLRAQGVDLGFITLHTGYGTFAAPSPAQLRAGRLHGEWVEVKQRLVSKYQRCREKGGRVVAVGTTSARALEWACQPQGQLQSKSGCCHLLIAPGFHFNALDGLMTNFHLPRTTLLLLVSALMGRENIRQAYREAIKEKYRFYSFGDAMLIL
jgi:S-adenosylmethionine:tRNA ribosyltransferase-isomerase